MSVEAEAAGATPVVIDARVSRRNLGVREVWSRRELLYFLVWRDLKVRYRQTAFGVAWALLQPLLLMVVFTLTVGRVAGLAPAGVAYPLFTLAGLVPWVLFSQGVTSAANSLVAAEGIITKVYFPRLLLPISAVASFLIDFVIAAAVLGGLITVSGHAIPPTIVLAPAMAGLALLSAVGVGTFLSAVNVRFRDVRHAIPFLIQAWLFASPVIYPIDVIPEGLRTVYAINPMVGAVEGFRWTLLGGRVPATTVLISIASTIALCAVALLYFRRAEQTLADVI
jgi:lipopolysaccharide transport system permease protein